MIRGHEADAGWGQDALAVKLAAVEEHLGKAEVVLSGGDHATAAGRSSRLRGVVALHGARAALGDELAGFSDLVLRGEARQLGGWQIEASVDHAEGCGDVVTDKVGQGLARELLDDVALDVH